EQALAADAGQQVPAEDGLLGVPGLLVQQAPACRLHAYGDGGQGVGEQVDKQQVDRLEGHRQGQQRGVELTEDAGGVAAEQELDGVFDVSVHTAAVDHRLDDGGEVVVGQDHGGGVLGYLGAGDAHGHDAIRLLQGGGNV